MFSNCRSSTVCSSFKQIFRNTRYIQYNVFNNLFSLPWSIVRIIIEISKNIGSTFLLMSFYPGTSRYVNIIITIRYTIIYTYNVCDSEHLGILFRRFSRALFTEYCVACVTIKYYIKEIWKFSAKIFIFFFIRYNIIRLYDIW